MKVIRAESMGMCFGVRDAIAFAKRRVESGPLTVLGDLAHNERVVGDLRSRGVRIEKDLDGPLSDTVMITAHGASEARIQRLRGRGHEVLEATCPLVRFAHRSAARLVSAGYFPLVIGMKDHVEVRGLTEDWDAFEVALTEQDIDALPFRPRYGVVAQTTQPVARVEALVERLRARFPESEIKWVDTVCRPTKERQSAAVSLAKAADVVVVVGGAHSNNTRQLVKTSESLGARAHHVQSPEDVDPAWFTDGITVGLTAGTSTPDEQIDAVEARLKEIAASMTAAAV